MSLPTQWMSSPRWNQVLAHMHQDLDHNYGQMEGKICNEAHLMPQAIA